MFGTLCTWFTVLVLNLLSFPIWIQVEPIFQSIFRTHACQDNKRTRILHAWNTKATFPSFPLAIKFLFVTHVPFPPTCKLIIRIKHLL